MRAIFSLSAMALAAMMATSATAATIDFTDAGAQGGGSYIEDGLVFDDVRIVNGNCASTSGPECGAENVNETSTLTSVTAELFSLESIWYSVQGKGTVLTIATNLGGFIELGAALSGTVIDLTSLFGFTDVTWITFTGTNGNVRFDDLVLASPVPLPAAGLLLLGALGGLTVMRKRKTA